MPLLKVTVEVATDCTAPVPAPYNNCDEEKVVAPVPPLPTRSGVMSVRAPAESNVEVAVAPKYAVPVLEKRVEEALRNDWRAVQLLAFAMFRERELAVPPTCAPRAP